MNFVRLAILKFVTLHKWKNLGDKCLESWCSLVYKVSLAALTERNVKPSFDQIVVLSTCRKLTFASDLVSCVGAVRLHNGSLQHLVWLGLQWNSMSVLPPMRKWLKQLFHLPQETSRLETDAPESICLLDLEVSELASSLMYRTNYVFW